MIDQTTSPLTGSQHLESGADISVFQSSETVFTGKSSGETLSPVAIQLTNVSKRYAMFAKPEDRLRQMVVPRLQKMAMVKPQRFYKEFSAVNDVSLTIRRGETVGIIGRNGSGKSTLLQMIVGTLTPTSGTVNVQGRIAALLELGAGFNPEFTGRENVYVNGAILGFNREEMDDRFDAIAAFAGIGEFIERPVKTYSSGMFVRLAFAVATAVEPDILVVDEALSVGDEAFQRKCFTRIEAIKERGGTILFVSHGAQIIVQLCDRAILLDGGEKILEGDPKNVVGQYQRLVNTSADAAVGIRNEIIAMGPITSSNTVKQERLLSAAEATIGVNEIQHLSHTEVEEPKYVTFEPIGSYDYWDDTLHDENLIQFENRGADIQDIRVETLDGYRVNVLLPLGRYRYCYRVKFTEALTQIGFGMLIKTIQGLGLGGATTTFENNLRLPIAVPGDLVDVEFEFTAALNPAIYYLNAGVTTFSNNEFYFAHRILDAIAVRVVQVTPQISTGIINIEPKPSSRFVVEPH